MNDTIANVSANPQVEAALREDLAHGDALIGTIAPILRHLLANDDHSLFSDEIIARVRGMMHDVARQLLDALGAAAGQPDARDHPGDAYDAMVYGFISDPAFLAHTHALALEWQLTERLQARLALDPVLSPLVQALVASADGATGATAMALLAAQARFVQNQRRMQLPLSELPADLLHAALQALRTHQGAEEVHRVAAETAVRVQYDESRSRLGLIARLIAGMGGGATAALSITHAGAAMFLSALSLASGQSRDTAVLSTNEGQLARLALALRASGLKPQAVEEQFVSLHPEVSLPEGFEVLGADRAAALLARSVAYPGA
ncbi:hypothetical protein [Novosphingobium sp.]|uniref:hypothetical protein n=1 Tax=Novosphingobium sp. TaxID=1874826 RepID=UPI0027325FE6|nr:hypothetical protein [Novosphingobium sp.]MDP3906037.1 hypothetical protein [Novosphingobium sp.]